jgi:hypothetical protein
MKKVHAPENVAHLFANQLQSEARTQTNNFYFFNDKIYSYGSHFVIAKHYNGILLFTERSYSNTTAKHISHVRNASSHKEKIFCAYPDGSHDQNFNYWINEAEKNIDKLKRAKKVIIYLYQLDLIRQKAERYAKVFGISIPMELEKVLNVADKDQASEYESKKAEYLEAEKKRKEKELKKDHAKELKKWRNFETTSLYLRNGFDYLRYNINKKRFETSQRVEIPLEIGLKLYEKIKNNIPFEKVLDYSVQEINKTFIQVGCHKITLKEINTIMKTI